MSEGHSCSDVNDAERIHEDAQIMYIVGAIVSWLNQMSIKMADIPEPFFCHIFFGN